MPAADTTPPQPVSAAVTFDPKDRQYSVLGDKKLLEGVSEGEMVEMNGRMFTVLHLCKTITEAKAVCQEKAKEMKNAGVSTVSVNNEVLGVQNGVRKVSPNGDESMEDEEDGQAEITQDGICTRSRYRQESESHQIDYQVTDVIRDMMTRMMYDFAEDVNRLNHRFQNMKEWMVKYFGTSPDGAVVNSFEELEVAPQLFWRMNDRVVEAKFPLRPHPVSRYSPGFTDMVSGQRVRKRRYEEDDAVEDEFYDGPQAKKTGTVGFAPTSLRFPFNITREVELQVFQQSNGSASTYAQKMAKILFGDTLELYFKDQNPKRRAWLHECVDYRFPSPDKNTQMMKWKNCASAINKNMREKEKQAEEILLPRDVEYKYLTKEYESSVLLRANGDPHKYSELMSMKLFETSLDKFFRDQDVERKDWLRDCVDRRFPLESKQKRDDRWKVCASACNKNRTKIIGKDGLEEKFPYFPQEKEVESFERCNGNYTVYAVLINRLLFPDTQDMLFKDQDIGRRNWFHEILDKRFPTSDKLAHVAKWKACTSAINKAVGIIPGTGGSQSVDSPKTASTPSSSNAKTATASVKKEPKEETQPLTETRRSSSKKAGGTATPTSAASNGVKVLNGHTNGQENGRSSNRLRKKYEDVDAFDDYFYMPQDEEIETFQKANGNVCIYARNVYRIIFKDSLDLYFKDQDPETRTWFRKLIDFRFPTNDALSQKQKWKNISGTISRNLTPARQAHKE